MLRAPNSFAYTCPSLHACFEQLKSAAQQNGAGSGAITWYSCAAKGLILSKELKADNLFLVVNIGLGKKSYHPVFEKNPYQLAKYFQAFNYIFLYPAQDVETKAGLSLLELTKRQEQKQGKNGLYLNIR